MHRFSLVQLFGLPVFVAISVLFFRFSKNVYYELLDPFDQLISSGVLYFMLPATVYAVSLWKYCNGDGPKSSLLWAFLNAFRMLSIAMVTNLLLQFFILGILLNRGKGNLLTGFDKALLIYTAVLIVTQIATKRLGK